MKSDLDIADGGKPVESERKIAKPDVEKRLVEIENSISELQRWQASIQDVLKRGRIACRKMTGRSLAEILGYEEPEDEPDPGPAEIVVE